MQFWDGKIPPPRCMGWLVLTEKGVEKLKEFENRLHAPVDTILLGKKKTIEFISYWSNVINNPGDPEYSFAKKMIETPKIVFTKILTKSEWPNT